LGGSNFSGHSIKQRHTNLISITRANLILQRI
jgi:hypothetical protein